MNTKTFAALINRHLAVVIGGLCLTGALLAADTTKPVPAASATSKAASDETRVGQLAAEQEGLWDVAVTPGRVDPRAAEREGLWDIAVPHAVAHKIAFDEARIDPLVAERSGLWNIDVAAGCGDTKCARSAAKRSH